jgi:transcriptional regulator with XRE-family HTH domain
VSRHGWGFSREALVEIRDEARLSNRDLAALTGIIPSYVRDFVTGYRQPTDDEADALAEALGVDPWLLHWQ